MGKLAVLIFANLICGALISIAPDGLGKTILIIGLGIADVLAIIALLSGKKV